ncbi:hypothetical protein D3C72_2160340 [compost metagenome]
MQAGRQAAAQDVRILRVHDVDLQGGVVVVHGADPALQPRFALRARHLGGVARQVGGIQAVQRIEAIPGDRGGQHHAAHQDDRHGAPEGQEGAPEQRAGGQAHHHAAPAST